MTALNLRPAVTGRERGGRRSGAVLPRLLGFCAALGLLALPVPAVSQGERSALDQGACDHLIPLGHLLSAAAVTPEEVLASSRWTAGWPTVFPPDGVHWLRLYLPGFGEASVTCALKLDRGWRLVELFQSPRSLPVARSGWSLPADERSLLGDDVALPITVPPGGTEVLLRLESRTAEYLQPATWNIQVVPWERELSHQVRASHLHGLYGGILVAICLYNFFLFLSLGDRLYLLYVLYAGAFGTLWLVRSGIAFTLLWPHWPVWNSVAFFFVIVAALLAGNSFVTAFLDLPTAAPALAKTLRLLSASALVAGLAGAAGLWRLAPPALASVALAACVIYLVAGMFSWRRRHPMASLFLLASGALIAGTIAYILGYFGFLPRAGLVVHAAQLGSAVEMLLLALALGRRYRTSEQQRLEAEWRHRSELEAQVALRTAHLNEALQTANWARELAQQTSEALQRANEKLAFLSVTDPLTGLANRRHLDHVLRLECQRAARTRNALAVVFADVDHFKAYNDALGHAAGDQVLRKVAQELKGVCRRAVDTVARYGGEEFAMVLPDTPMEQAARLGEKLRVAVANLAIPHPGSPDGPYLSISVGVAGAHPPAADGALALLAAADEALYRAKHNGRNRIAAAVLPPTLL